MAAHLHYFRMFFRHLLSSHSRYRLHSPFVYRLYEQALTRRMSKTESAKIGALRSDISSIPPFNSIDHGTGNNRQINGRQLLRMGISNHYGRMLCNLSRYFQPEHILETGTSIGLSTAYLALGHPQATLFSVESCPEKCRRAQQLLTKHSFSHVRVTAAEAHQQLEELKAENYRADLVFIDSDHRYSATMDTFQKLKPLTHENSVVIFDDIYWSPGMTQAWNEIISDERVTLSIATFRLGMIFFRSDRAKQHFRLRI